MENQNVNPLEQGMQPKMEEKTPTENINSKAQDTSAENVLGTLASVILWFGIIVCFFAFFSGLIMWLSNTGYFSDKTERTIGFTLMGSSTVLFLSTLVSWACLKMMVNISRNIFVIKETLLKDKESHQ